MSQNKLYFAYGANLNIAQMAIRCPNATPIKRYTLDGYRLEFDSVATVVKDPASHVPGALWLITPDCERSLDKFEGWPHLYQKQLIETNSTEFMLYVMPIEYRSAPSQRYYDTIAEGYCNWQLDSVILEQARNRAIAEDNEYEQTFK